MSSAVVSYTALGRQRPSARTPAGEYGSLERSETRYFVRKVVARARIELATQRFSGSRKLVLLRAQAVLCAQHRTPESRIERPRTRESDRYRCIEIRVFGARRTDLVRTAEES